MSAPVVTGIGEIAALVAESAGRADWYAVVVPEVGQVPATASLLSDELQLILEGEQLGGVLLLDSMAAVTSFSRRPTNPAVVIASNLEATDAGEWESLNFLRSRLLGDFALVFVLTAPALQMLQDRAPDLDTLLRSSTFRLAPQAEQISDDEREARLQALRAYHCLSDAEVVDRGQQGTLPPDPAFAEWLTLLGRGDLLGPR